MTKLEYYLSELKQALDNHDVDYYRELIDAFRFVGISYSDLLDYFTENS
jgi:hypothetical protein